MLLLKARDDILWIKYAFIVLIFINLYRLYQVEFFVINVLRSDIFNKVYLLSILLRHNLVELWIVHFKRLNFPLLFIWDYTDSLREINDLWWTMHLEAKWGSLQVLLNKPVRKSLSRWLYLPALLDNMAGH